MTTETQGHLSEVCYEGACENGYIVCLPEPGDPPCTHDCHKPTGPKCGDPFDCHCHHGCDIP